MAYWESPIFKLPSKDGQLVVVYDEDNLHHKYWLTEWSEENRCFFVIPEAGWFEIEEVTAYQIVKEFKGEYGYE